MNPRTTRWLVGLALGLAAYILLFEWRGARFGSGGRRPEVDGVVIFGDLAAGQVTSMEVGLGTNQVFRVERSGPVWRLSLPVAGLAESETVEAFLKRLMALRSSMQIPAAEVVSQKGGLGSFGLENPVARLVLMGGGGRQELRVGGRSPLGGQLYVQRVGRGEVEVVDGSLLEHLPARVDDWRDHALLRLDRGAFDGVEVRSQGLLFELRQDVTNRSWRLARPVAARANDLAVEPALGAVLTARVEAFAAEGPGMDVEALGLQPPQTEVVFRRGTNAVQSLWFGGSPSNAPSLVYARTSAMSNVVVVAREVMTALRPPATRFRDPRLAPFVLAQVESLEVQSAEPFVVRRQTNGVWRVAEPYGFDADARVMEGVLKGLEGLEVTDFVQEVVADYRGFGLSATQRQYTVRGAGGTSSTNNILAQVQLGSPYQSGRQYARRTDEPALVAVRMADAQQLPEAAYQVRDRQVFSFKAEQVVSVLVEYRGQTRKLIRTGARQWSSQPVYALVNGELLEEALHRLGELRALAWVARGDARLESFGFSAAAHQLTLEVKTGDVVKPLVLRFGQGSPWNSPFGAVSMDGQALVFGIPPSVYDPYELVLGELKLPIPVASPVPATGGGK